MAKNNDTWQGNMFEVTKITDHEQVSELIAGLRGEHPFCIIEDKYFVVYKMGVFPASFAP